MADRSRPDEERERPSREEDEKRREDKERRSSDLQEAWRRNHPGEHEEEEEGSADTRKDVLLATTSPDARKQVKAKLKGA